MLVYSINRSRVLQIKIEVETEVKFSINCHSDTEFTLYTCKLYLQANWGCFHSIEKSSMSDAVTFNMVTQSKTHISLMRHSYLHHVWFAMVTVAP